MSERDSLKRLGDREDEPVAERPGAHEREERTPERRFERFLIALEERKRQVAGRMPPPVVRRSRSAIALIPVVVLTLLLGVTQHSVVDADQFLRLAEKAARAPYAGPVRYMNMRFTPNGPGDAVNTIVRAGVAGVPRGLPESLVRVLAEQHFQIERPFDVERFEEWRASHVCCRRDLVSRTSDGLLLLTTTAWRGPLHEAALTVHPDTFRVVRLMWMLDMGRFDVEDVAYATPAPAALRPPAVAVRPRVSTEELDATELNVRIVLGQTGIDMRGDARVSRTADAVRVDVLASAAQRRGASARLAALPHVQVALRLGADRDAAGFGVNEPGLVRWVDRRFGLEQERASFVPELRRSLDTVRQRLALLAGVSQRFPGAGRDLSPASRALLERLVDLHFNRLTAELNDLKPRVAALSGIVPATLPAERVPHDWPRRARVALARANDLQEITQELFARDDLTAAEQQRVGAAFAALWDTVHEEP